MQAERAHQSRPGLLYQHLYVCLSVSETLFDYTADSATRHIDVRASMNDFGYPSQLGDVHDHRKVRFAAKLTPSFHVGPRQWIFNEADNRELLELIDDGADNPRRATVVEVPMQAETWRGNVLGSLRLFDDVVAGALIEVEGIGAVEAALARIVPDDGEVGFGEGLFPAAG